MFVLELLKKVNDLVCLNEWTPFLNEVLSSGILPHIPGYSVNGKASFHSGSVSGGASGAQAPLDFSK